MIWVDKEMWWLFRSDNDGIPSYCVREDKLQEFAEKIEFMTLDQLCESCDYVKRIEMQKTSDKEKI